MRPPPRASGRTWLFRAGLVVIASGAGFGLGELGLRLLRPRLDIYEMTGKATGPNPMGAWAHLDAFSAFRARPGSMGKGKTANRAGYISTPEVPLAKARGLLRIAFFGESSTAGTGFDLADRDTWPWVTMEALRATGTRCDFLNAALGGYTTFESYGRFWSRVRFYEPDVVVVNHGWNEMYYFASMERVPEWRTLPDGSWSFDRLPEPLLALEPHPLDPVVRHSRILTRLRLRWDRRTHGEAGAAGPRGASTYDPRGLEVFRTNLRLFREAARILGARLLVMKQPTLVVEGLSPALQERCAYHLHGFGHDAHVAAYRAISRVIDEEIPAEDVMELPDVSGRGEYFHDHVHPTVDGAAAIGKGVAAFVAARIGGRGPSDGILAVEGPAPGADPPAPEPSGAAP